MLHQLLFLLGLTLAFPVAVLTLQTLMVDISWSGRFYVLGMLVLELGLVTLPLRKNKIRRWPMARIGFAILLVTALLKWTTLERDPKTSLQTITRDQEHAVPVDTRDQLLGQPVPDWLVNERDMVLSAAQLLQTSGRLKKNEARGLAQALQQAYSEMEEDSGSLPTPVLSDLASINGDSRFSALVVEPKTPPSEIGIIFLHGYAGSWTWPCWQIAQAAQPLGAVTLCPSVGFKGDWWTRRGRRIADQSIRWLKQRGAKRIYLMGLSNGAAGVAVLGPALKEQLEGLVFISGMRRGGSTGGLPALFIQGDGDTMMPTHKVRRFAKNNPGKSQYLELQGNHFVLLHRRGEIGKHIENWLLRQERPHWDGGV